MLVDEVVEFVLVAIKVGKKSNSIARVLPQIAQPGAVNGHLVGPVCSVESIHRGDQRAHGISIGEPLISASYHHAISVAQLLDLQFHARQNAEITTTSTSECPEEHPFLGVRSVAFVDSNLLAIRGHNSSFHQSITTHSETSRKGAKATAHDESTHAYGRASPAVDNEAIAVASVIDKRFIHITPLATGLHRDRFRWQVQFDPLHSPQIQRYSLKCSGVTRVGMAGTFDGDFEILGFGFLDDGLNMPNILWLNDAVGSGEALEEIGSRNRAFVFFLFPFCATWFEYGDSVGLEKLD